MMMMMILILIIIIMNTHQIKLYHQKDGKDQEEKNPFDSNNSLPALSHMPFPFHTLFLCLTPFQQQTAEICVYM